MALVLICLLALLVINGISTIRDPYVHYAGRWVPMSSLDPRTQPIYCASKPVSWLYDRLTGLFLLPVFYCFSSQQELDTWIAAGYPMIEPPDSLLK